MNDRVLMTRLEAIPAQATLWRQGKGRPLVTLTYAQSLDGSIAARRGYPLDLSGPLSRVFTHRLRALHDAILVGIGTVLADNPCLNVRLVPGRNPQPVILDSRLRFPSYARLLKENAQPWIATLENADPVRQEDLESRGAKVIRLPQGARGGIELTALLDWLTAQGIACLMVEGGAQVITSFLSSRLVDQVIITIAPVLVGGLRVLDSSPLTPERPLPRLAQVSFHQLGEDLVIWGRPEWTGRE
jgi:GTP cyclohydrolase II